MAPYDLLKEFGLAGNIRDHALRVARLVPKYVRPPNEIPADTRGTLTFGERLGLVLVTQTAFLSFFFVGGLLIMITVRSLLSITCGFLTWAGYPVRSRKTMALEEDRVAASNIYVFRFASNF
jgi:hypothetical protein